MEKIGEMPEFSIDVTIGEKYFKINKILKHYAKKYKLTLWQVDYVWCNIVKRYNKDEWNNKCKKHD